MSGLNQELTVNLKLYFEFLNVVENDYFWILRVLKLRGQFQEYRFGEITAMCLFSKLVGSKQQHKIIKETEKDTGYRGSQEVWVIHFYSQHCFYLPSIANSGAFEFHSSLFLIPNFKDASSSHECDNKIISQLNQVRQLFPEISKFQALWSSGYTNTEWAQH